MKTIGKYTYCPTALTIHYENQANLTIGKYCSIGDGVEVYLGGEHRKDWLTSFPLHQALNIQNFTGEYPTTKGDVIIGNDVWIGRNVTIVSGVTIGDGAVIGLNSIVAKNIPAYEIWVGNPARFLKYRFDEDTRIKLLEMKWWNWSEELISLAQPLLQSNDIDKLYSFYKENNPQ